jgi:hypothetical protein
MRTLIIMTQIALLVLSFIMIGIHLVGMLIRTDTFIGFLSSIFILVVWIASATLLFYHLKQIEKEL